MKIPILIQCLLFFCAFTTYSYDEIKTSDLAQHPSWIKLGHYNLSKNSKSYITTGSFFLSENGHHNPLAELKATINAFRATPKLQCKYPARLQWLKTQGFIFTPPKDDCVDLIKWRDTQPIHSVSLVFASGYMSNPASLYGHMLLKLNRSDKKNNKLLDYSINYGAIVPSNENGLIYILNGLFGGYEAGFSDQLFYRHQHNYGEIELRDLWEYTLNFEQEDVTFLSNHLWELLGVKFDYYFADENCAYHIARLIELVTGDILTKELSPWIIPSTVFSKLHQAHSLDENLIKDISFTPSRTTSYLKYHDVLTPNERKLAQEIYLQPKLLQGRTYNVLPLKEKKRIIETLFEFTQLQEIKKVNLSHNTVVKNALISSRLILPIGNEINIIDYHENPPHEAQKPSKLSIAANSGESHTSLKLGFRLSYFDSLASDDARIPFSNLEMLDVEVSAFDSHIYLEKLHIIDLESFNPSYTSWPNNETWSWQLNIGFERDQYQCFNCQKTFAMAGFGKSYLFNNNDSLIYSMINGYFGDISKLDTLLNPSMELGIITTLYSDVKLRSSIEHFYNYRSDKVLASLEVSIPINKDLDIRLSFKHQQFSQWELELNYYWD